MGNGKTSGAVARLLTLASRYPGSRWVVFRQEYKTLTSTTRATFYKVCPPQWIKRDVQDSMTLINDAEILWIHMDAADEKFLRGLEINGTFGDQIEEIHPEMWELMDSRIGRWQLPEWGRRCPPYIWGTCNPEGHDWVYYRFHPEVVKYPTVEYFPITQDARDIAKRFGRELTDADRPLRAFGNDKMYLFGNTLVNLAKLNEIEPSYVANLLKKPKSWQDKWVFGNRQIFEGMIHRDWNQAVHVYNPAEFDPFKARQIRSVWGFFDYGLSAPTCLQLVATDNEGYAFFFREYYAANKKVSEHANSIKQIMSECQGQNGRRVEGIYADPSVFYESTKDRATLTTSVAEEYASQGLYFLKADNNEDSSIERINSFLSVDASRISPVSRLSPSPRVFISKECTNLIEQIPQQRWKKQRNLLTGETEFVEEREEQVPDHAYDPFRYWANSKLDYKTYTGPIKTHSTSYGARA